MKVKKKFSIMEGEKIEVYTYKDYIEYEENEIDYNEISMLCEDEEPYYIEGQGQLQNEHDKIFRKILDDKQEASKFINKTLKLKRKLKEEDIEKYNRSFVTKYLKNEEADVIYKLKNRDVFFLIEHQTKIDYTMPLRILEYETQIMESAIDREKLGQKGYKLPIVISIVLYSGRRKWNAKTYIREAQEKLKGYKELELARYNIVDVNDYSEEELLKEETFISKAMLIEKIRYTESLTEYLEKIIEEMKKNKVYTESQKELLITIIDMVLSKKIGKEETKEMIKNIKEGEDKNMLAVLEMIEEENKMLLARGERKGIKETTKKYVKKMIEKNMPIEMIIEITGLTKEQIEKL